MSRVEDSIPKIGLIVEGQKEEKDERCNANVYSVWPIAFQVKMKTPFQEFIIKSPNYSKSN